MTLPDGEPAAGPWRPRRLSSLTDQIFALAGNPGGRPRIVAVDGRSASGTSTVADRIRSTVPRSVVLSTDDIAWHESFFEWGPLLRESVLEPVRAGRPVQFRPPAWQTHGRAGSIDVPAGLVLVVVEGVGAGQRALDDLIDVTLWVQSDFRVAEKRGIARDIASGVNGDAASTIAFWHEWMTAELRFLAADRPWDRADIVLTGTPPIALEADEIGVAPPLRTSPGHY